MLKSITQDIRYSGILVFSILLTFFSLEAASRDIYVSPTGKSSNSGTRINSPWKLQYAADRVRPGDIVYLTKGIYSKVNDYRNILTIHRGGEIENGEEVYVTFKAAPGHKPVIKASGSGMWSAIFVTASYVRIEGLEVIGDNANLKLADALKAYEAAKMGGENWLPEARFNMVGINIGENDGFLPHHVEIKNCKIHDFAGGGIQVIKSDYILLKGNTVYNTSWFTMYAESGISIFHSINFDNNTKTYRMIVSGNTTYNNYTQVPWIVTKADSDGNGIIIDSNRETPMPISNNIIPYTGRVLVENNVSYDNGGAGISVYQSDNVDVVNNTTYGNGKVVKYPEISINKASNCRSFSNISYAMDGIVAFSGYENPNFISDFNIYYGKTSHGLGENDLNVDPQFTDHQQRIFTLRSHSPGIDSAGGALMASGDVSGKSRPQGGGNDRGAYER